MKYRIMGTTKVKSKAEIEAAVSGFALIDDKVSDGLDDDLNTVVRVDIVLERNEDKDAIVEKLSGTGLTIHECLHKEYTGKANRPCPPGEVL